MGPLILALTGSFYVIGSAPGLTWLDAGELAAASHELGIAHPPGLPLFSVFNKLVALAFPFGDIGFRGNLASGILAALAIICATRFLRSAHPVAMLGAALLMMSAPILVLHSTTVEVYAGAAFLAGITIWSLGRAQSDGDQRWLVLAAFILGLSIGGHHAELRLLTVALLIPCLCLGRSLRGTLTAGVAGVFGTLVIAYLPIRSALPLWRDWGDPSTLSGVWDHFWGARIRAAYGDQMGTVDVAIFGQLWDQLALGAPVLAALGLVGCILAFRRTGGWLVAALLLTDLFYSIVINPMGVRDMQNGIFSVVALGIGTVICIDDAFKRWPGHASLFIMTVTCLCGTILSFQGFENTTDRGLPKLVHRIDDLTPPEGLALVASDNLAAGLAYGQVVEGLRPDMAVVVRQHIRYASSVGPVVRRLPNALEGWKTDSDLADIAGLQMGWPILWEWSGGSDAVHRPPKLQATFPIFSTHMAATRPFEQEIEGLISTESSQLNRSPQYRRMAANLSTDIAQYRMEKGEMKLALDGFKRAVIMRPNRSSSWTNLGTGLAANGQKEKAIEATLRALELDPKNRIAQLNLGRFLILKEEWKRAAHGLRELISHAPTADAYGLLGVALGNAGQLTEAKTMFEKALLLDPNQPEAKSGLSRMAPQ